MLLSVKLFFFRSLSLPKLTAKFIYLEVSPTLRNSCSFLIDVGILSEHNSLFFSSLFFHFASAHSTNNVNKIFNVYQVDVCSSERFSLWIHCTQSNRKQFPNYIACILTDAVYTQKKCQKFSILFSRKKLILLLFFFRSLALIRIISCTCCSLLWFSSW